MGIFDNILDSSIKRKEEAEQQKLLRAEQRRLREEKIQNEKKVFLERNDLFIQKVMDYFQCSETNTHSWIAQREFYRQNDTRTVFIGFEHIHIHLGNPPKDHLNDKIWPVDYTFFHPRPGECITHDEKKIKISYPDDLAYRPISDYTSSDSAVKFTKKDILHLVATKILDVFRKTIPHTNLSELKLTEKENGDMYYYFTYKAPFKKLNRW